MSVGLAPPSAPPTAGLVAGLAKLPTLPFCGIRSRVGRTANPAPNLPTLLPTLPYILWSQPTQTTRDRNSSHHVTREAQMAFRVGSSTNPANPATNPAKAAP